MNKGKKKRLLRKNGVALFLLVSMLFVTACGNTANSETAAPEQETFEKTQESLPPVEISMPEYSLSYSGEFKDVIRTKEIQTEDKVGLQFLVQLSETEVPIFTLYYHSDAGELVTVLTDAKGNKMPIAFEMNLVPENLDEADTELFCRAQDAVNEIVESLVLK